MNDQEAETGQIRSGKAALCLEDGHERHEWIMRVKNMRMKKVGSDGVECDKCEMRMSCVDEGGR
jgi:hypothetical protein